MVFNGFPNKNEISIYFYKNERTDFCLSVCWYVGMWSANGNLNPCTDLDKILHAHPHLPKEGFDTVLTLAASPPPPCAWRPETLKAEGHIFENYLQNKRCSAGCKLIRAEPGISASLSKKLGVGFWGHLFCLFSK